MDQLATPSSTTPRTDELGWEQDKAVHEELEAQKIQKPPNADGSLDVNAKYNEDGTVSITLTEEELQALLSGNSPAVNAALVPSDEMMTLKESILAQSQESEKRLGPMRDAIKVVKGMGRKVEERSEEISEEIVRGFNQHIAALEARREDLLAEVQALRENKLQALIQQGSSLEEKLKTQRGYVKAPVSANSMGLTDLRNLEHAMVEANVEGMELTPIEDAAVHFNIDDGILLAIPALGQVDSTRTYAPSCVVEGDGLKGAWRGRDASFVVITHDRHGGIRNTGGDALEVIVQAPLSTYAASVEDQADGSYVVNWTPAMAGEHCVSVTIRGKHVQGSPFFLPVKSGRNYTNIKAPDFSIGGQGDLPGSFMKPRGVAIDIEGRILVADMENHRIQIFRADGTFIRCFGSPGVSNGRFNQPSCVAAGLNGHILVTDRKNHRVQVFRPDGTFLYKFGAQGAADGAFNHPAGIAVDHEAGRIIVADKENHRVQIFNADGTFSHKFGRRGAQDGQFDWPVGVAVDHLTGTIFVADKNNHRIQVFDPNGDFLHSVGYKGSEIGEFEYPWDVAVDTEGNIAVVEETGRVQIFQADGACIHTFGGRGKGPGKFGCPWGVALGSNGQLVIADRSAHNLQVF